MGCCLLWQYKARCWLGVPSHSSTGCAHKTTLASRIPCLGGILCAVRRHARGGAHHTRHSPIPCSHIIDASRGRPDRSWLAPMHAMRPTTHSLFLGWRPPTPKPIATPNTSPADGLAAPLPALARGAANPPPTKLRLVPSTAWTAVTLASSPRPTGNGAGGSSRARGGHCSRTCPAWEGEAELWPPWRSAPPGGANGSRSSASASFCFSSL